MFVAIKGMMIPTKTLYTSSSIRQGLKCSYSSFCGRYPSIRPTVLSYPTSSYIPITRYLRTSRLFTAKFESTGINNIDFDLEVEVDRDEDTFESEDEILPVDELEASDEDEVEQQTTLALPKGTNEGFYVVKIFKTQSAPFDMDHVKKLVDNDDVERLELCPHNISVPVALMMLDDNEFPSISRARKACRKANIIIHRGPLSINKDTGEETFDSNKCMRARVGDRLFPGGTSSFRKPIVRLVRMFLMSSCGQMFWGNKYGWGRVIFLS